MASLDRLAADRGRPSSAAIDWQTPLDRTRLFLPEKVTPLYYTASYGALAPEHRRRYNQLTGLFSNELIYHLETTFLDRALSAVNARVDLDDDLLRALRRFRDDEHRHARMWRRLNELGEPDWYRTGPYRLLRVPAALAHVADAMARHPFACPVMFWIQLAQEERSINLSRLCLQEPPGTIEPRFAEVYGSHLRDEVRHVQIDCHLIERFYARQSRLARRTTAALFRWVLARFLLRPARSTMAIVAQLASEYPTLDPLVPRLVRELRALDTSDEYHAMMYSRRTTPLLFELFDAFPEFHAMRRVLRAYAPTEAGGTV